MLFQGNQILLVTFGVLVLLCLVFFLLNIRLLLVGRSYKRLMKGVSGENLEAILQETVQSCRDVEKGLLDLQSFCEKLRGITAETIQKVGLNKFNAFPDMGNEMSFTLALLNSTGDGIVLCCLVGRDDCRLYAKPVVRGRSTYLLSDEEKLAINKALNGQNEKC